MGAAVGGTEEWGFINRNAVRSSVKLITLLGGRCDRQQVPNVVYSQAARGRALLHRYVANARARAGGQLWRGVIACYRHRAQGSCTFVHGALSWSK